MVEPAEHERLLHLAEAAGFAAVVDISDAFDGVDPADLAIHPSDFHPNAEGHALLARRLSRALWPLPALRLLHGSSFDDTGVANRAVLPFFCTKTPHGSPFIR